MRGVVFVIALNYAFVPKQYSAFSTHTIARYARLLQTPSTQNISTIEASLSSQLPPHKENTPV